MRQNVASKLLSFKSPKFSGQRPQPLTLFLIGVLITPPPNEILPTPTRLIIFCVAPKAPKGIFAGNTRRILQGMPTTTGGE